MATLVSNETSCRVIGLVLTCYRDGRKVFRPYVPAQDASRYGSSLPQSVVQTLPAPLTTAVHK